MEFKRILLKISGEALGGLNGIGIDPETLDYVCTEIKTLVDMEKEIAVVMGAGNFFRGAGAAIDGMNRVTGDQIGMIATIMNALALREGLKKAGIKAMAFSAVPVGTFIKPFEVGFAGRMLS